MIETELFEIVAQLQRDAGCRKVMLCGQEGEILAHAGDPGILDDAAADALAAIVVDALNPGTPGSPANPGPLRRRRPTCGATLGELQVTLPNGMTVYATPLLDRAALVVIFDGATTVERVRVKMRRARDRLAKSLPGLGDPTESTPSKS